MTSHIRHLCVVCQAELPSMTREVALAKGAAIEYDGHTYYRCIGRHAHDELLKAIAAVPKFTRASKAGA